VGITGTGALLPPGGRLRRSRVDVLIGPPLDPGPDDAAGLIRRARAEVIRLSARGISASAVSQHVHGR
jgi:hypothetical protein